MAPLQLRRRSLRISLGGLVALVTVVPAAPAAAGVGSWTSAQLDGGNVCSVAASPAEPWLVLAGTCGDGVFRSTDGGASWSRSSSGMPADTSVGVLTYAPSAPDTVFA